MKTILSALALLAAAAFAQDSVAVAAPMPQTIAPIAPVLTAEQIVAQDTTPPPKAPDVPWPWLRHEFSIEFSGGWANSGFHEHWQSNKRWWGTAQMGVGYKYFFTENLGLGTGLEFSVFGLKDRGDYGAVSGKISTTDALSGDLPLDITYKLTGFREERYVGALNIPVMFQYQFKYLYAALGAKIGIPIWHKYQTKANSTWLSASYEGVAGDPIADSDLGFGNRGATKGSGDLDLGVGIAGALEAGAKFRVSQTMAVYTGIWIDYTFNNIQESMGPGITWNAQTHGVTLNSLSGKASPLLLGLEARLAFGIEEAQALAAYEKAIIPPPDTSLIAKMREELRQRDSLAAGDRELLAAIRAKDSIIAAEQQFAKTIKDRDSLAREDSLIQKNIAERDSMLNLNGEVVALIMSKDSLLAAQARLKGDTLANDTALSAIVRALWERDSLLTLQLRMATKGGAVRDTLLERQIRAAIAERDSLLAKEKSLKHALAAKDSQMVRERAEAAKRLAEASRQLDQLQSRYVTVSPVPGGRLLTLSGHLFGSGVASLTTELQIKLAQIVGVLSVYKELPVVIKGYTDSQGSTEFNQKLSTDRAEAVQHFFVAQGLEAGRITATGLGESEPVATNETPEGRDKNRRVEIQVTEPGLE